MFCHCMNNVRIWGYPNELKIKDTTDTQKFPSYPDLHLEIDNGGRLKRKLYDFTFPVVNFPFVSSNIRATYSYGVNISQPILYSSTQYSHYSDILDTKVSLSRTNLDKLYLVYIRPLFEYACELWDNCGIGNSQKLEQLQLEAARIVTGLPIFTKTQILYRETGWELLSARRKRRKLQLFYNIVNKNTPNYLCTLIPPTIQRTSVYPLRNGNDIILPFCRLSSTSDSFIPSTIKMWNSLNNNIRNVDTLSKFKSELKKIDKTENHSVPKHFFCGPRKLNIILTQLRNSASFLNFDLFRVGIVYDPSCRCGAALENLKHFFLDCPIYIQARTILIGNINRVTTCYTLDIEFLTCGNDNLTYEQNCIIFKYVFDYIKCSKRFLIV